MASSSRARMLVGLAQGAKTKQATAVTKGGTPRKANYKGSELPLESPCPGIISEDDVQFMDTILHSIQQNNADKTTPPPIRAAEEPKQGWKRSKPAERSTGLCRKMLFRATSPQQTERADPDISLEGAELTLTEPDLDIVLDDTPAAAAAGIVDLNAEFILHPAELDPVSGAESLLQDLSEAGIDTTATNIVTAVLDFENPVIQCIIEPDAEQEMHVEGEAARSQVRPKRRRATPVPEDGSPKRRKQNPSLWKVNVAKLSHAKGLAHTSLKGKHVAAKEMGPGCSVESCCHQCHSKVSLEERQKIFNKFYNIVEVERKWEYVARMVTRCPVTRRTTADNEDFSRRKNTLAYHFHLSDNSKVRVCKSFFLQTIAQTEQIVRTGLSKQEGSSGAISPDKRGKHFRNKEATSNLKQNVKDHISAFKPVESHYCRKNSKCKYLPETLNIRKMHSMYLMERDANAPHTATYRQYMDIFKSEFNIKFQSPKKDQCALCLNWKYKTPAEKSIEEDQKKYEEHRVNRTRGYELKESDSLKPKTDAHISVASFDFQQILQCPKGCNDEFYYKSKLKCYNFSVFEHEVRQGHCYVWDQTCALKGATEVTNCVYNFIEMKVAAGVKSFIFYSDNCWSQNKNKILYSMYNMASHKFNIEITHRYLEKGHTHMEVDNMHALIERTSKNMDVFTPSQWYGIMKSAKKTGKRYRVVETTQDFFKNFEDVAKHHNWTKAKVSKIRELVVCKNNVHIKYNYNDDPQQVSVIPVKSGRPVNWVTFQLKNAYSAKFAIPKNALDDVKWFVLKGHIPSGFVRFYEKLFEEQSNLENVPPEHCDGDCDTCDELE